MTTVGRTRREYRVWIVRYQNWQPRDCFDVPPEAVAEAPAEEGVLSAEELAPFLEGFNGLALAEADGRWAVAIPVAVCYEGDPLPGATLRPTVVVQAVGAAAE